MSVQLLILAQVMISRFVRSSPASGSVLTVRTACLGSSVSLCLSVSQKYINKHLKPKQIPEKLGCSVLVRISVELRSRCWPAQRRLKVRGGLAGLFPHASLTRLLAGGLSSLPCGPLHTSVCLSVLMIRQVPSPRARDPRVSRKKATEVSFTTHRKEVTV